MMVEVSLNAPRAVRAADDVSLKARPTSSHS